jgi:AraC-like DNA-binding protein
VIRHDSALGQWEMVLAMPPAALAPFVREYIGWTERTVSPIYRRELPTEEVPLIFNFGAPTRLFDAGGSGVSRDVGSFMTGAYDTFVLVGSTGPSEGVQINLTIVGARLLAGRPLGDLANRGVALEDIFGRDGRRFESELYDARTWDARFARLDRELLARLTSAPLLHADVRCAWRRLLETHGGASIASIVEETGRSHRHLVEMFHDQLGLAPKTLGRVLRFGRAVRIIKAGRASRLTDLAYDCGYYDQAHFVRDCRALAGVTPTALVDSLLPDRGGFLVE